jgi:membrane protease YdiL (CAAX protease family)
MFSFVHQVNPAGWAHLAYFGAIIPLAALYSRRKFRRAAALPNRLRHFQVSAFSLIMFGLMSLAVARAQWISLFPRALPPLAAIAAGVGLYAAVVVYMVPNWRRAVQRRSPVVHLFMPSTAHERVWWLAVSVLAGISEEITWRGVQAALVGALTGSFWIAALICSISFGLAHIIQSWRSAAHIVLFAMGIHALVWLSESLYVAMAVHAAYDITAGIAYGRLGRKLGYDPAAKRPPSAVRDSSLRSEGHLAVKHRSPTGSPRSRVL